MIKPGTIITDAVIQEAIANDTLEQALSQRIITPKVIQQLHKNKLLSPKTIEHLKQQTSLLTKQALIDWGDADERAVAEEVQKIEQWWQHKTPPQPTKPARYQARRKLKANQIDMPENIQKLWQDLDQEAPTYLVGGAVRDILLGKEPKDWDFLFTGRRLPTKNYQIYQPNQTYQTYWVGTQKEPRLADVSKLRAATIEEDLQQRDATINSMALTRDGKLIDPTGGLADLEKQKIKTHHVDNLLKDTSRGLRLVKMAAQYQWQLPQETLNHFINYPHLLKHNQDHRHQRELIEILIQPKPHQYLTILALYGNYPTPPTQINKIINTPLIREAIYWQQKPKQEELHSAYTDIQNFMRKLAS